MSAYLPYIIVFFAVALIVGPVMMIKPSSRQTRAASLRSKAAQQGLLVKVSELKSPNGNVLMEYMLPRPSSTTEKTQIIEWSMRRHKSEHEGHYHLCWDWHGQSDSALCRRFKQGAQREKLTTYIDNLPAGVFSIGCNRVGAVLSWSEAIAGVDEQTAIDQIAASLHSLSDIQA